MAQNRSEFGIAGARIAITKLPLYSYARGRALIWILLAKKYGAKQLHQQGKYYV